MRKKIFLSSGDIHGIGLEVTLKSLIELGPQKEIQFVLWRSKLFDHQKELFKKIKKKFNVYSTNLTASLHPDFFHSKSLLSKNLIDIYTPPVPTKWVLWSAKTCIQKPKVYALVTGPLSKSQIQMEGYNERGHTGLLKKLSQCSYVFMLFLGQHFNVVLLSDHLPLKKLSFNPKDFSTCVKLCMRAFKKGFFSFPTDNKFSKNSAHRQKKLACLGLNPHAGENTILGYEDSLIKLWIRALKTNNIDGPLVPDIAFLKSLWSKYFAFLCLYHDQALIPFKLIHERNSLQISLGLPFIRTSVSHGCAKNIFGQNRAQPDSMKLAILKAKELLFSDFL